MAGSQRKAEVDQRSLVVIGGGWGGVAAAIRAVEQGWMVTLIEERPYLGGRARSFVDRTTGDVVDNGQHLMVGAYHAARHIMDVLGTTPHVRMQRTLRVPFIDAEGWDVLQAGRFMGPLGIVTGLLRLRRLSLSGRFAIIRLAIRMKLGLVDAHGRTCLELLQDERQPLDAILRFWDPVILATINAPSPQAHASLLVEVMRQAFAAGGEAGRLMVPTVGLSDLIAPFQEWMSDRGHVVLLSTSCDQLVVDNGSNRVREVVLSDGQRLTADAVVAAVPQKALMRLLAASDIEDGGMTDTPSSPIVSVYLWYDKAWLTEELVACLGATIQWVFNKSSTYSAGRVSLTVSAGSDLAAKDQAEIVATCDAELRSLFADMKGATLMHGLVIKERHATPLIEPGVQRVGTDGLMNVVGSVAIAGDWTDTGLPATIEGAARSGVKAVEWLSASTTLQRSS